MIKQGLFEDAVPFLENGVFLQQKFTGESSYQTFWTLCLLVACLNAADNLRKFYIRSYQLPVQT